MTTQKKLRFFLDTEFNEHARRNMLDPISIALVPEEGTRANFHAISNEFDEDKLTPWLKKNVLPYLPPKEERISNDAIRDGIIEYFKSFTAEDDPPQDIEIWAYNGSTDNVVLANFFGGLMNMRDAFNKAGLPKPQFRELKELVRATGEKLPPPENAHDCLEDTLWARKLFKHLSAKLKKTQQFLIK